MFVEESLNFLRVKIYIERKRSNLVTRKNIWNKKINSKLPLTAANRFIICFHIAWISSIVSNSRRLKLYIKLCVWLVYTLAVYRSTMYNASWGIGTNKYSMNSDFRYYGYRKMISIYLLVRTKTFGDRRRMHFFSVSTARRKLNWNRNYIGFTSHAS